MSVYVDGLKTLFSSHADPIAAEPMKAYMRNQFAYLGIKMPLQRALLQDYINEHGLPELSELPTILLELWALPEREFQYAAQNLLDKFNQSLPADFIETIETMLTTKSWWDTVDPLAVITVGTHFKRFPEVRQRTLARWRISDDFWLRRTCILFQNRYKSSTDFNTLTAIICENLDSKEFFINKAIGWALREYTRVDPDAVREFVARTPLSALSAREALKWLNKRAQKDGQQSAAPNQS